MSNRPVYQAKPLNGGWEDVSDKEHLSKRNLSGVYRTRILYPASVVEALKADNEVLRKQAERYEKLRMLDARQLAEIFRMNIQEGIPFDEIIDGLYIYTAEDIAEAEKEGEKMWHALCGDSTQDIGKDE